MPQCGCEEPAGGMCVLGSNNAHSLMMPPGAPGSGPFCPAPDLSNANDMANKKCHGAALHLTNP